MKTVVLVCMLIVSALVAPAAPSAYAAAEPSRCDNPQYPDCPPTYVYIRVPSRPTAGRHLRVTCEARVVGTNADPVGTLTFRLAQRSRVIALKTRGVGRSGKVTFSTPRLRPGRYNARCVFKARAGSIFRDGLSYRPILEVRRR